MKIKQKGILILLAILLVSVFCMGLIACNEDDDLKLSHIQIGAIPKTIYLRGESLDLNNGTIELHYTNGTFKAIPICVELNGQVDYAPGVNIGYFNKNEVGQQNVTISYGGKSFDLPITVNEAQIRSISVNTLPQTNYFYGEENWDLTGGKVDVFYDTGAKVTVDMNIEEISIGDTYTELGIDIFKTVGSHIVDVNYRLGRQVFTAVYTISVYNASTITIASNPKTNYTTDDVGVDVTGGRLTLTGNNEDGHFEKTIAITPKMVTRFDLNPTADPTSSQTSSKQGIISCGNRSAIFTYTVTNGDLAGIRYAIWAITEGIGLTQASYAAQFPYSLVASKCAYGSDLRMTLSNMAMDAIKEYNALSGELQDRIGDEINPVAMFAADHVQYYFNYNENDFSLVFQMYEDMVTYGAFFPAGHFYGTYEGQANMFYVEVAAKAYPRMLELSNFAEIELDGFLGLNMNGNLKIFDLVDHAITTMVVNNDVMFAPAMKAVDAAVKAFRTTIIDKDKATLTLNDYKAALNALIKEGLDWTSFTLLDQLHNLNYDGLGENDGIDLYGNASDEPIIEEERTMLYHFFKLLYENGDYDIIANLFENEIFPLPIEIIYNSAQNAMGYQYTTEEMLQGNADYQFPNWISDTFNCDYYVRAIDDVLELMKDIDFLMGLFHTVKFNYFNESITLYDFYYSVKFSTPLSQLNLFGSSSGNEEFEEFMLLYTSLTNKIMVAQDGVILTENHPEIAVMFNAFTNMSIENQFNFMLSQDAMQISAFYGRDTVLDTQRFSFFKGNDYAINYFMGIVKYYYMSEAGSSPANLNQKQQRVFKWTMLALEEYAWLMYDPNTTSPDDFIVTMHDAIRYFGNLTTTNERNALRNNGLLNIYDQLESVYLQLKTGNWQPSSLNTVKSDLVELDKVLNNCLDYLKNMPANSVADLQFYGGYEKALKMWNAILAKSDSALEFYLLNSPATFDAKNSYVGIFSTLKAACHINQQKISATFYYYYKTSPAFSAASKEVLIKIYDNYQVYNAGTGLYDDAAMADLYRSYLALPANQRVFISFVDAFTAASYQMTMYGYLGLKATTEGALNTVSELYYAEILYTYLAVGLDPMVLGYDTNFFVQIQNAKAMYDSMKAKELTEFEGLLEGELLYIYNILKDFA